MRGGVNGDSRASNNTLDTINAAATAIASAENRVPQATVQKRRWGSCWSIYWCFGFQKQRKRIGHSVLVPEPTASQNDASAAVNSTQAPALVLPFVAPPSSPASFLPSEPPSATQSPAGLVSLNSISANMYSPGGPTSIFAIGPYAHETQLVSPPVFSTFTTEPSTAPFTPPPESVHLTTPSSPEVPFAQLLDPNLRYGEGGPKFPFSQYEFQSYHLHPGSPVGNLISPGSGISGSGTSSPFPDSEFASGCPQFPDFRRGDPPKLLNLDKLSIREWGSRQGSGTLTPDAVRSTPCNGFLQNHQLSEVALLPESEKGHQNDQIVDHRVSFELTAEDVVRCVEKKPATLAEAVSESLQNGPTAEREESSSKVDNVNHCRVGETSNDPPEKAPVAVEEAPAPAPAHQKQQSITLGSGKEFNFDSADGDSHEPNIASDWWANEKVVGKESGAMKNWAFFPMMQPGVS
ncbi:Hydroxyproline-rich glycoprotein family protein [Melia azedarach]|uniref:Hydroxyproline-rich glycoprotein family protein n=1 Tax=Melia azedarach TaxID=155640 RepID=A0ACC1XMX6_MELAZ|nr:Hydroxyproline-rich glycoprotein family protein [Melia azedarach]